jgi:hypothetical protein
VRVGLLGRTAEAAMVDLMLRSVETALSSHVTAAR